MHFIIKSNINTILFIITCRLLNNGLFRLVKFAQLMAKMYYLNLNA